jgi:glycosyltransferase involved in cell wall biosynthesis/putative flippase GtrA
MPTETLQAGGSPPRAAPPTLEVAIPVHNEVEGLEPAVRRLHRYLSEQFPFSWRLVIVDNASTDGTLTIARDLEAELSAVQVVHIPTKGRGIALRTAWMASDAVVVAYTDVDLSTGLDALLPLVAPLVSGHSDVAIGSRLLSSANVARGPKREATSRAYNLLLRLAFSTRVHDAQCGFKAVRADVARELVPAIQDNGWFFDTELLLLAEHNGLRIHEVAVDWVDDPDSRVDLVRTALEDLKGVVRLGCRFATGRGRLELGDGRRRPFDDDLGRRLIPFAIVGSVSTIVSLALFVALRQSLGSVLAVVTALAATMVGNSWAHRRWTLGRRGRAGLGRHALVSGAVAVAGIGGSALALTSVGSAGGGLLAELAALAVVWSATTVLRLWLLSRHAG